MSENNPENELSYLDDEDWQIAFEPYQGQPQAALTLGFHLTELKRQIKELRMQDALAALDRAVDQLYEHSEFRSVSREMFRTAVTGQLTTEQGEQLRQLGIRI